jgi:hypothetical protein
MTFLIRTFSYSQEAAPRDGGTPRSDITGSPSPTFFGDISMIAFSEEF